MSTLPPGERRRIDYANEHHRDLYLDIGHFIVAFGTVDYCLSAILASLTQSQDPEMFDVLARGMDARVKVERIRKVAKLKKGIGTNLKPRLEFFESTMISVRNDISHSALVRSEDEPARYLKLSLGSAAEHLDRDTEEFSKDTPHFMPSHLFQYGEWLWNFARDLQDLIPAARRGDALELAHPRAPSRVDLSSDQKRSTSRAKTL